MGAHVYSQHVKYIMCASILALQVEDAKSLSDDVQSRLATWISKYESPPAETG